MDDRQSSAAEIGRLRDELDKRDQIIASLQARVEQLQAAWDEIYDAGARSVMAAVPEQARRRDRIALRVIRGGLGAGIAAAVLGAARQALLAHRVATAVTAVSMAAAAGAAAPLVFIPGPGPAPVMAAPPAVAQVPPYAARHDQHSRGHGRSSAPSPGGVRTAPPGSGSGLPSPSQGPQAAGSPSAAPSPSPTPSPTRSPSSSGSPHPSPSPSSPAPVTSPATPAPSPAPPHCLITILGLCV